VIQRYPRRLRCAAVLQVVSRAVLPALLCTAVGACRVDDDAFQSRVFRCDTSAADPLCGTDVAGEKLQCFAARQIGATDFCAPQCGEIPKPLPDEGAVCVQGNAKLKSCNPTDHADVAHPDGACDRAEFGCLRTNVLPSAGGQDEGVCLTMKTCSQNSDCRDPVRSVCAATFLKELYADAGNDVMHADSLYCLQKGCEHDDTSCSPGESCLRKVLPIANPPDICVPNCDSNHHCPPNHFCLQAISGPANPAVCIPGLLGFVCDTDVDCLVGTCIDDGGTGRPDKGDNLNLCTMTCASDKDCSKFDSQQGLFVCNTASSPAHCATPNAYQGATCKTDQDCGRDLDSRCMRSSASDEVGTCLHPCTDQGGCAPRGGINQTCFPLYAHEGPVPVCFPGFFGLPCFSDNNCVGDLTCRGADLSANPPTPGFCTTLCVSDGDCAANRWTSGGGCALPEAPICVPPPGDVGATCFLNAMCTSGVCDLTHLTCAEPRSP
jgi:hypothetical protein